MRLLTVAPAGLLVIAVCCYPPYEVEAFYPADGERAEEVVYTPIWSPPSEGEGEYRKVDNAELAVGRLGIQIVVIVAVGSIMRVATPTGEK
jgi:hypothetical protein